MNLLKKFRKVEEDEEEKKSPQLKWREKVYDDDEESVEMYKVCEGFYQTLDECVKEKGYNQCAVPERRDYFHCLLEQRIETLDKEKKLNFLQKMRLKLEYTRGNTGDTYSDLEKYETYKWFDKEEFVDPSSVDLEKEKEENEK
eukprot:gene1884-1025_t